MSVKLKFHIANEVRIANIVLALKFACYYKKEGLI